jgi:hypothetical protein
LINLMANSAKSIHLVRQTLVRSFGDGIWKWREHLSPVCML